MPLHVSSTYAHHQEVKIALHSLWCHHTYRWPSGARVEGGLVGMHSKIGPLKKALFTTYYKIIVYFQNGDKILCKRLFKLYPKG